MRIASAFFGLWVAFNAQIVIAGFMTVDTTVSSLLGTDSVMYEIHLDTLEIKYFHPRFGPITINGATPVSSNIPLPAGAGTVVVPTVNVPIPKVYLVTFDPTSPDLSVTVTNNSTVAITGGSITILGTTRTIQDPLGPGASQTLNFPTAGQMVPGTLGVSITETSAAAAGKSLGVSFNFNGLVASSIRCVDSLINFWKTYINDYPLSDTIDIDYIDMQIGAFVYSLKNYATIPLEVRAEQLHLWDKDLMAANNITTFEQIQFKPGIMQDSAMGSRYWGDLTQGFKELRADSTMRMLGANLAQCRLFPVWNDTMVNGNGTMGKSVSRVKYTIRTRSPTGATISLNAADSMFFTIKAPAFNYREMSGIVKRAYVREGDTAKIKMSYPAGMNRDSLRARLLLNKIGAKIRMVPGLPDSTVFTPRKSRIDTMDVRCTLFNPGSPAVKCIGSFKWVDVVNGKISSTNLDMTAVLSQLPDSMYIAEKITIPVGTRIRELSDLTPMDPDYARVMGRMNIKIHNSVLLTRSIQFPIPIPITGNVTVNNLTLKWHPAVDLSGPDTIAYFIQIDTTRNFVTPIVRAYIFNDTCYSAANLPVDTIYWRVVASFKFMAFSTPFSSPSSFIIVYDVNDARIPKLIPYFPEVTREKKPVLQWHRVAGAASYTIMISNADDFSVPLATVPTSDTTYTVLSDLPEGNIYWKVRSNLLDFYSLPDAFTIVSDLIPILDRYNGAVVKTRRPAFRWLAVPGDTLYKIEIAGNRQFTGSILVPLKDTFYIPGVDLSQGKQFWRVSGSRDFNAFSPFDSLVIDTAASVIPLTGKKTPGSVHVACFNKRIAVSIPETFSGQTGIAVFSLSGKCVFKTTLYRTGLYIVPARMLLANSVYSVIVTHQKQTFTQKMFVQ